MFKIFIELSKKRPFYKVDRANGRILFLFSVKFILEFKVKSFCSYLGRGKTGEKHTIYDSFKVMYYRRLFE